MCKSKDQTMFNAYTFITNENFYGKEKRVMHSKVMLRMMNDAYISGYIDVDHLMMTTIRYEKIQYFSNLHIRSQPIRIRNTTNKSDLRSDNADECGVRQVRFSFCQGR